MSKFYKSTNYIAIIKNKEGIVSIQDCDTYKGAVAWIQEQLINKPDLSWKIHRVAQTFKTLPVIKDKEQLKERIDKKYSIEEVHALFDKWKEEFGGMWKRQNERIKVEYDGHLVKTWSQRYEVFRYNTKCVVCGLQAAYYRLEKPVGAKHYHFNLYGIKDGEEVLFTKDHILPRAKGGTNTIDNYQTMCYHCNQEKADKLEKETGIYYTNEEKVLVDPSGEHNVEYMLSL